MSLRVLHVITRLSLGGSSENTLASIAALQRVGHEVALAVSFGESDPPSLEDARRRGVRLVDAPGLRREPAPLRDLRALRRLLSIIAAERPHVVHTHTSKAGFVGRLAARLARVPAVVHQPHGHAFYGYWGRGKSALFAALERRAARWSDRIVTLTDRGIEEHLARRIGRRAQYVSVPSGVPVDRLRAAAPSRAAARERLHLEPAAFVVAGLGRLTPIKGFDLLVEALPAVAAAVPDARLVLIGDGPERAALEARAAALGVGGRLTVTGAVGDVTPWLAAADVVAAPSRNEGMGRVIVEAMALGVPVVGAAVGGIPSVIADGECGRLVPPEDPAALARALVELGRDGALRARLGAAGVRRAEAFALAVADRKLCEVYEALAREKGLPS